MNSLGFGFSLRGFRVAIKIVKHICRALRDTDGANDKFRHVFVDLQHLDILLDQLNGGTWDRNGDAGHPYAIKGMASTCKIPLQNFHGKLEQYRTLGTPYLKESRL